MTDIAISILCSFVNMTCGNESLEIIEMKCARFLVSEGVQWLPGEGSGDYV